MMGCGLRLSPNARSEPTKPGLLFRYRTQTIFQAHPEPLSWTGETASTDYTVGCQFAVSYSIDNIANPLTL